MKLALGIYDCNLNPTLNLTLNLTLTIPRDELGRKKPVGVADFVRNAGLAAVRGFWQIIEIQSTDTFGEFSIWAMTSRSQLQKLRLGHVFMIIFS
jgi:hypothetical protein